LFITISVVYGLIIVPIIGGAEVYFIMDYIKHQSINLNGAFNYALNHSIQLILGTVLYIMAILFRGVLLIIPGIYLLVRLHFVMYAIISENCSAIDGFKYSSKLVTGRWWQVWGSMLLILIFFVPIFITGI
jgi:uncharacterized membrane protein (UPF0182 family)